jgi:hypothetical protein
MSALPTSLAGENEQRDTNVIAANVPRAAAANGEAEGLRIVAEKLVQQQRGDDHDQTAIPADVPHAGGATGEVEGFRIVGEELVQLRYLAMYNRKVQIPPAAGQAEVRACRRAVAGVRGWGRWRRRRRRRQVDVRMVWPAPKHHPKQACPAPAALGTLELEKPLRLETGMVDPSHAATLALPATPPTPHPAGSRSGV